MPAERGWKTLRAFCCHQRSAPGERVCSLFNKALKRAIRDSKVETTGTIFCKSTQILAYADNIEASLVCGTPMKQKPNQGIEQAAENLWLQINQTKTKLMVAPPADLLVIPDLLRGDVRIVEHIFEVPYLDQRHLSCRSGGTVVNSYDLTTCPSWVQALNWPCPHTCRTDFPAMCNKSLKANGCFAGPKKKKNQKDITDNSMEDEFARQPVHSINK